MQYDPKIFLLLKDKRLNQNQFKSRPANQFNSVILFPMKPLIYIVRQRRHFIFTVSQQTVEIFTKIQWQSIW